MSNTRSPQIRLALSLDGNISDVHVIADTAEGRDRALAKLRQFLPAFELIEQLAVKPSGEVANEIYLKR